MPQPLVRRWLQRNSSNICNLVLHHWLTEPTRAAVSDFHRTHGTEAPHSLYIWHPLMHSKPFSPSSQSQGNSHKWDFEGKKWSFLDAVESKENQPQNPYIHVCVPWKNFILISTVLGQCAACASKTFCKQAKSTGEGWMLLSSALCGCSLAAKHENMRIKHPKVKISKYLFATTLKLLSKHLKTALLKASNPSTDPGTTWDLEFSIAAALFLWKHKFSLNWIWHLKSKEI